MSDFARSTFRRVGTLLRGLALAIARLMRSVARAVVMAIALGVLGVVFAGIVFAINLIVAVPYNVAFRALDPDSEICRTPPSGWDILADSSIVPPIGNDENLAVERGLASNVKVDWARRLHCSIQTHAIPGYQALDRAGAPVGDVRSLSYDLAFLEFQENGDPYLLCNESDYDQRHCDGVSFHLDLANPETHRGQFDALLERLKASPKNYVVAFIHGWRDNADIGNGSVANLRFYAGSAARFVADRCAWGDQRFCGMKTTAIFIGWRGARSDENRLRNAFVQVAKPFCGAQRCWFTDLGDDIATIAATFTLFDRKPVSEAIAPSVISALRAVARQIGVQGALRPDDLAPCESAAALLGDTPVCQSGPADALAPQGRMIVFGHSLGGNVLATGLLDETIKLVELHKPGDFLPPPLGNLIVLLNPAAEAMKWTGIQRAVWRRVATSDADEARTRDVIEGHGFFRDDQRPVLVAATAARDWPPDGIWSTDCANLARQANLTNADKKAQDILREYENEAKRRAQDYIYDSATYDLFPAFSVDFRPLASSLERYAQRSPWPPLAVSSAAGAEPSDLSYLLDGCATHRPSSVSGWLAHYAGAWLRVFPFMNTDAEKTHTIGQLDPPRSSDSLSGEGGFSERRLARRINWWAGTQQAHPPCVVFNRSGMALAISNSQLTITPSSGGRPNARWRRAGSPRRARSS
jgi:hypothetical protein